MKAVTQTTAVMNLRNQNKITLLKHTVSEYQLELCLLGRCQYDNTNTRAAKKEAHLETKNIVKHLDKARQLLRSFTTITRTASN